MTDEQERQARMIGGDAVVEMPEIIDAFPPAIPLGEEAEDPLGARAVRPWPRWSAA